MTYFNSEYSIRKKEIDDSSEIYLLQPNYWGFHKILIYQTLSIWVILLMILITDGWGGLTSN